MRLPAALSKRCLTAAAFLAWTGCAEFQGPTGPSSSEEPSEFRNGVSSELIQRLLEPLEEIWTTVATQVVYPGTESVVSGSRYTLTFKEASLEKEAAITIKERQTSVVDVELGPDGEKFLSPVVLQIDYAGTANDPKMPNWHRKPPRVFWFDPRGERWVLLEGRDDPEALVYTVELYHFSRYAMSDGTGGWEGPDDFEGRGDETLESQN